jgi:hypothetical protein
MVHAWQSGEAGIGRVTGTVAMEQLSLLLVRRSRTGDDQCRLDGDFFFAIA